MDTKQILRDKLKQKIQEKNSQRYQLTKKSLEKIKNTFHIHEIITAN
jgi:sRNA-binding carbon storage regulator CsrA